MTKMTKYILLLIAFLGLISCRQEKKISSEKVEDVYQSSYTVNQLCDKLEFCYKHSQHDSLRHIFVDWNVTIKPNSEDFICQNETIEAVFAIYREFYKPFDLLKLGDWEWGNDLNSGCKYVVVQNKIFYSVLSTNNFDDFDWQKSRIDSIENFRPSVNLDKDKVLYLTNEYAELITNFLGTESTELGEENIMNPSIARGESEKRYEVLRQFIPILHGHWGGYWHIETHPVISVLIFNKRLTKAKIHFRVGYQGGEALIGKRDNKWIITESKETWIE